MKKILTFVVGLFAFAALINADDRPVPFDQLPEQAKTFVKTNFASAKVLYSSVDDDIIAPDYEVILDNGFEIQFKNDGRLESIDANMGSIPESIIPDQIKTYVQAYPVILSWGDVALTALGVATIGYLIALIPANTLSRRSR